MNGCRSWGRAGDWVSGLSAAFARVEPRTLCRCGPGAAPSLRRGQATTSGDKPRRTAMDLARKVQREKATPPPQPANASLSGPQRRTMELKRLSLQLQNVHPNVLAKHLHRGVLHQDQELVAINKPFGVPARVDSRVTSISSVLPVLSKMMDGMKIKSDSQLLLCLGLEKETTGVLLLARSEAAVEDILDLHRKNQVQRKYWVITVGVPVPSEGVIDIPIIEREVPGPRPHYKMALSPRFKIIDEGKLARVRAQQQSHPAVTKYRVLDSCNGCSLVELQPLTSVKHQMRVHMAFALACPILGDHKYSHWNKLAPRNYRNVCWESSDWNRARAGIFPFFCMLDG